MIERVARELYAEWVESQMDEYAPWELLGDKETWLVRARRAVGAMREPTEAMVDAAANANWPDGCNMATWSAMIDAALSPSQ